MIDVTKCPECGGQSNHQHTTNVWNQCVEHVRTCQECPTEYVVTYASPVIEEVTTHD